MPSEGGDLAAYSAEKGDRLWRAQGEGGWLKLFEGVLYSSLEGRGIDALSPATGNVAWQYQTPDTVAISGVVHGLLYGAVSHLSSGAVVGNTIIALNAGTGKLVWQVEIGAMQEALVIG